MPRTSSSSILIVHLARAFPEAVLRGDLAGLLGLRVEELVPLTDATPAAPVSFQVHARNRGFLTTLELYVARAPATVPRCDLDLGVLLARHFGEAVLIAPREPHPSPFLWELVLPSGETRPVREIPSDDDASLVIER